MSHLRDLKICSILDFCNARVNSSLPEIDVDQAQFSGITDEIHGAVEI